MISLPRLKNLKILSMGRNNISRIQYLDDVSATLEELWLSYNFISRLDGLGSCSKLHTIYIGNNKIARWDEIAKCASLPELKVVLFFGNPVYDKESKQSNWPMVVRKIPQIETIDGTMVTPQVRAEAEEIE